MRRFSRHRKQHNIVRWSFQPIKRRNLDAVERELIHRAPTLGLTLTNKVHVSQVVGETDLDGLLAPDEQQAWLAKPAVRVLADPAVQSAAGLLNLRLMRKGGNIYARFHCFDLADRLVGEEASYAL